MKIYTHTLSTSQFFMFVAGFSVYMGAIFIPLLAQGAVFNVAEEQYSLSNDSVITENLYVASQKLFLRGNVEKDVLGAASEARFSGVVGKDISVLGGKVFVTGPVGDDLRIIAGELTVSSFVGGDFLALGGLVIVEEEAHIGGEVALAGGEIRFGGVAERDAKFIAERVYITGDISGNVSVSAKELVVVPGVFIGGTLTYPQSTRVSISPEANIVGDIVVTGRSEMAEGSILMSLLAFVGFFVITEVLVKLVSALVLYWKFRPFTIGLSEVAFSSLGQYTLWGLSSLILVPLISFLLIMSFVGWMLGLLLLFFYGILVIVSFVYAGILFGAILSKIALKEISLDWRWILLGVLSLELTLLVPIVGWVLYLFLFLVSLGTLSAMIYRKVL